MVLTFSKKPTTANPTFAQIKIQSEAHWAKFWNSGGVIDLSGSKDPRWMELERRIVLSQYVMAVNESSSMPPQDGSWVVKWEGLKTWIIEIIFFREDVTFILPIIHNFL